MSPIGYFETSLVPKGTLTRINRSSQDAVFCLYYQVVLWRNMNVVLSVKAARVLVISRGRRVRCTTTCRGRGARRRGRSAGRRRRRVVGRSTRSSTGTGPCPVSSSAPTNSKSRFALIQLTHWYI